MAVFPALGGEGEGEGEGDSGDSGTSSGADTTQDVVVGERDESAALTALTTPGVVSPPVPSGTPGTPPPPVPPRSKARPVSGVVGEKDETGVGLQRAETFGVNGEDERETWV